MKKNNQKNEYNRIQRFSIRKYSFGAASVAIATYLMFMGNGAVYAAQEGTKPIAGEVNGKSETPKKEEIPTPTLDKTQLVAYIAEIELNISNNKYANKTEESVEKLKSKIETAKSVVVNAKTQNDLKKAYNALVTSVNSGLRNKPAEEKPAPGVDTTNGQPTVGKKAGNTEPKEGTNAIENTGSHDSRNGKVMENGSGFRTDVTAAAHEETTREVGDITYITEFSDDKLKEIYVYNKEEANIEFKIKSKTNKVTYVETTGGSNQKFATVNDTTVTDGYGYNFDKITTETDTPLTVRMTGQPNNFIMGKPAYNKNEGQNFAMGDRYLRVTAKDGSSMSPAANGVTQPGYFKIVLKSQTYKYQPEK